jgi:hypothetical protein
LVLLLLIGVTGAAVLAMSYFGGYGFKLGGILFGLVGIVTGLCFMFSLVMIASLLSKN